MTRLHQSKNIENVFLRLFKIIVNYSITLFWDHFKSFRLQIFNQDKIIRLKPIACKSFADNIIGRFSLLFIWKSPPIWFICSTAACRKRSLTENSPREKIDEYMRKCNEAYFKLQCLNENLMEKRDWLNGYRLNYTLK